MFRPPGNQAGRFFVLLPGNRGAFPWEAALLRRKDERLDDDGHHSTAPQRRAQIEIVPFVQLDFIEDDEFGVGKAGMVT